jgi:hypothetical protein
VASTTPFRFGGPFLPFMPFPQIGECAVFNGPPDPELLIGWHRGCQMLGTWHLRLATRQMDDEGTAPRASRPDGEPAPVDRKIRGHVLAVRHRVRATEER